MSTWARWLIGAFALLTGSCLIPIALALGDELPLGPWPIVLVGAVCLVVAVACFFPKSSPITLRIIGGAVFLVYVVYVVVSINTPNLPRALLGFLVIGLPFGVMAVYGKYPSWGRGAAAFDNERQPSQPERLEMGRVQRESGKRKTPRERGR